MIWFFDLIKEQIILTTWSLVNGQTSIGQVNLWTKLCVINCYIWMIEATHESDYSSGQFPNDPNHHYRRII